MSQDSRANTLLAAVCAVVRRFSRLLIAEQVPFSVVAELLKSTLVEEAERSYRLPDKSLSDSRVSLLTGVHRKDVKRLRSQARDGVQRAPAVSLGARLIADWNARPEFLDSQGRPLPLYRSSARGRPSVRDLTETAGQDIRPQSLVDEWLRQGVIFVDDQNRVCLKHGAFVPEHDFEEKAQFFGRNLGSHMAAAVHNLTGDGKPLLDQAVYYDGLTAESCARLERRARELAMGALRALNREAYDLQQADASSDDAAHRIHFGAYFHCEPERGADGDA